MPFDVISEFVYADRAAFDRAFGRMMTPEAVRLRETDEARLFDIPAIRVFMVETCDTDCSDT
jgi:hypothetical protein